MLKQILKLYKGHRKWIFLFSFLTLFNGVLSILIPYGTKLMVSSLLGEQIAISIKAVFITLFVMITIKAILWFFYRLISDIIGSEIELKLRLKIYKHIQKLPSKFFKEQESGKVTSTIINDISSIKGIAQSLPEDILWIFVIFTGVMVVSFITSREMFIVMGIVFVLNALLIWLTSKDMKKIFLNIKNERANINQHALNSFHGISDSKAFGNESFDFCIFKNASVKYRKTWWNANKKIGIHDMVNSLSYFGSTLAVLGISFYYTQMGMLTLAEFIMFQMYMGYLFDPIHRASSFAKSWADAKSSMLRIERINRIKPQKDSGKNILTGLNKSIDFKNITLKFKNNLILKNLSLKIKANQHVALVGRSGGGKTTIVNTILRFIDDYKGDITIDSKNIKSYTLESLRANIGLIQQNPYIFPGTLFDNVKYGKTGSTKEEVINAIKQAELWDLVLEHKKGIRMKVGENGIKLSGGQKQRVAIARVILRNPQIVILDEATSALDTATERKIQIALTKLMKNRTSIVIAHRLNTIMNADNIIVIGDNKVISQGNHKELMKKCKVYKELQGI